MTGARFGGPMFDAILIVTVAVFFAVAVAYVRGCDRM
jgi:hypothetical protein